MVIEINDYGVQIGKKNKCFLLARGGIKRQISPFRVTAIHIRKACDISSSAILLAAEFEVPILFFNSSGKVKARLWQTHFGSKAEIRRQQLRFSDSGEGLAWVCNCLALKLQGQMEVLTWLGRQLPAQAAYLTKTSLEIGQWKEKLEGLPGSRTQIRVLEAQASKLYWQAYFTALRKYENAEKRTRQPATDPLNTLINYGYGMLYGEVESATLTSGLDPQTGILHREEYNRPAFVFDAIEPFRPWVDRLVAELAIGGEMKKQWFSISTQKVWLKTTGKKVFIPAWYEMIYTATYLDGKRIKRKDQIQKMVMVLAQYLLKEFALP